jgi:hypothetical protein
MNRQKSYRRRLSVEMLESRTLLAGNVTASVAGGSLVIDGDDLGNGFQITQNADGTHTVTGLDFAGSPTTVNGMAAETFAGVTRDFKIKTKRGHDFIFLRGDPIPLMVPRHVGITSAQDDDNILIQDTTVNGKTGIRSGTENDIIQFVRSTLKDAVKVRAHGGDDLLGMFSSTFERKVSADMSAGVDEVLLGRDAPELDGSTFRDEAKFSLGTENDHLETNESMFDADVAFLGLSGDDDFDIFDSVFAAKVGINGGKDTDTLTDVGNTYAVPPTVVSIP